MTIREVERILKPGGEFICTARKNVFERQSDILGPMGFQKDEVDLLCRQARLYSGPDDLIADCENAGLKLVSRDEFTRPGSHERVVMVFVK